MPVGDKLAEFVCDRESSLRSDQGRQNFEVLWQQVARLVLPRKAFFKEKVSPGTERTRWILDSTAPRALELFASSIHTLLNNPATRWFSLSARRDDGTIIDTVAVKEWFEIVENIMLNAMTRHSANVYSHLHQAYFDLGAFGTAVLYVDSMRSRDDDLRIKAYHLGDCVIDVDENGLVNELHREFKYTASQAKARWPDRNLGRSIEELFKTADAKSRSKRIKFFHAVLPVDEKLKELLPPEIQDATFASVWVNKDDRIVVATGRFDEFPYVVPRWYVNEREIYGRSPGITMLPDIRMVNRIKDTLLRALEKFVDPPLLLPDGGMVSPIRLSPGSVSFSDGNIQPVQLIPQTGAGIQAGQFELEKIREVIREGFFIPLFATPESPVKTATQVLQEADERNRALSPMLVRQQSELFDPLVRRTFRVMDRVGMFPPPPDDLAGSVIDVQYNSPLVASQKQSESLGTARMIESYQLYVATTQDDSIFDNLDRDEIAKVFHEGSGAPTRVLKSEGEREEQRDEEDAAEGQAEGLNTAIAGAGAVADLAKAGVIPTQG